MAAVGTSLVWPGYVLAGSRRRLEDVPGLAKYFTRDRHNHDLHRHGEVADRQGAHDR